MSLYQIINGEGEADASSVVDFVSHFCMPARDLAIQKIHFGGEIRSVNLFWKLRRLWGIFLISTMAIFKIFGGEAQGFGVEASSPPPPVDRTLPAGGACLLSYRSHSPDSCMAFTNLVWCSYVNLQGHQILIHIFPYPTLVYPLTVNIQLCSYTEHWYSGYTLSMFGLVWSVFHISVSDQDKSVLISWSVFYSYTLPMFGLVWSVCYICFWSVIPVQLVCILQLQSVFYICFWSVYLFS